MWTPEEKLNYVYAFMKYNMKDMELDFWQDDFIKNNSRYICLNKSRRTGYSFITAAKGIVKMMDPDRTKYVKQYVSYNIDDALEKIRYAQEFYDSIPKRHKKVLVSSNKTTLEVYDMNKKTTSRLISLPCRPPRGKGGDIALDEYAIYTPKVSNTIYQAALYCIMRGGCIEVGSTPLGTIGKFYEICTNRADFKNYVRYTIPWWFANALCKDVPAAVKLAPSMTTEERVFTFGSEILQSIFQNSSLEDFQQECECLFVDSASSYISLDLIYANTPGRRESDIPSETASDEEYYDLKDLEIHPYKTADDAILNYDPEKHGKPLYFGYDVAKNHDATAFYLCGVVNGKKRTFYREEMRSVSFESQLDTVRKLYRQLPIFRGCMDCTGMGAPLYESLHNEFGDRIEGVTFTVQSKEEMAMAVKFGLERHEFELENDRDFHNQIHSIKRIPTTGGNFRYDADRNEKGHADSFWAWALANIAAREAKDTTSFYSQYAQKKRQGSIEIVNSLDGVEGNSSRIRRGRSSASILNSLRKNNR